VSNVRFDRYAAALSKVNAVLYEVWAPIGFVGSLPRDEYETYAVRCVSLLAGGAREQELVAYLVSVGAGLGDGPAVLAEQSAEAAKHLMQYQREASAFAP